MLGIITLIEGLANACMPTKTQENTREDDNHDATSFFEVDTESQARGHDDEEWRMHEARFQEFKQKSEGGM